MIERSDVKEMVGGVEEEETMESEDGGLPSKLSSYPPTSVMSSFSWMSSSPSTYCR